MLDLGLSDAHQDPGGQSEIVPFLLAEDREGVGDGFEDVLGANLDLCSTPLRIATGDLAGADGHEPEVSFRVLFVH